MRLLLAPFLRWLGRLSHPKLFMVIGGLFLLDMVTPDLIPFMDEILLGAATLVFAKWKKGRADGPAGATDSTTIDGSATRR